MGGDGRARAGPGGGAVAGLGRVDERGLGRGDGRRPAPGAAAAEAVPDRGRRGGPAPGARAAVQPALPRRRAGRRPDAGARAACRPRPDARGREAGGAPRAEGLPRDGSRGWTAAGGPWPLRAQRRRLHGPHLHRPRLHGPHLHRPRLHRLGELVRTCGSEHRWFEGEPSRRHRFEPDGDRPPMHAAGVHRRRHQRADADAVRALGEPLRRLRGARGALEGPRPPGRLLAQDHRLPRRRARRPERPRHDRSLGRAPAERQVEIGGANSRPGPRAASRGPTAPCRTGS